MAWRRASFASLAVLRSSAVVWRLNDAPWILCYLFATSSNNISSGGDFDA